MQKYIRVHFVVMQTSGRNASRRTKRRKEEALRPEVLTHETKDAKMRCKIRVWHGVRRRDGVRECICCKSLEDRTWKRRKVRRKKTDRAADYETEFFFAPFQKEEHEHQEDAVCPRLHLLVTHD